MDEDEKIQAFKELWKEVANTPSHLDAEFIKSCGRDPRAVLLRCLSGITQINNIVRAILPEDEVISQIEYESIVNDISDCIEDLRSPNQLHIIMSIYMSMMCDFVLSIDTRSSKSYTH